MPRLRERKVEPPYGKIDPVAAKLDGAATD